MAGGLPISIFILRGFFVRQPRELEDAAVLDGCSTFDVYWRVMLPLARPGLAAVAIIQFLYVWNEYLLALVMFSTDALMPIQRGLTQFVSSDTPEQHILLAATAMAVLPVIVLYVVRPAQHHPGHHGGRRQGLGLRTAPRETIRDLQLAGERARPHPPGPVRALRRRATLRCPTTCWSAWPSPPTTRPGRS